MPKASREAKKESSDLGISRGEADFSTVEEGNGDGVLLFDLDSEGRLARIAFGSHELPSPLVGKIHKHANTLLYVACSIGKTLARLSTLRPASESLILKADLELLRGDLAAKFHGTIKKADWFKGLFGSNHPFRLDRETLLWDISPGSFSEANSAIRQIIIRSPKTIVDSSSAGGALEAFESLVREYRARIADYAEAISASVKNGAEHFCKAFMRIEVHRGEDPAFKTAYRHIKAFSDAPKLRCFHMHLLSLIEPKEWCRSDRWRKFHQHIHQLALKADGSPEHRCMRRLHILANNVKDDPVNLMHLLDVMLSDLEHHIDSRALIISPKEVDYRANVPIYKETLLMNYGTFSMRGGNHAVIISTGRPYFEGVSDGEFGVYEDAHDHTPAGYYYLRHCFQHFWNPGNGRYHDETLWEISQVLEMTKATILEKKLSAIPGELRYFVGKISKLDQVLAEIESLLQVLTGVSKSEREIKLAEWFFDHRKPTE